MPDLNASKIMQEIKIKRENEKKRRYVNQQINENVYEWFVA
jgi:hypothetical protein